MLLLIHWKKKQTALSKALACIVCMLEIGIEADSACAPDTEDL